VRIIPAVGLLPTALINIGLIAEIVTVFSIQRLAPSFFDLGEVSQVPLLTRC
jgi:hypothetical protein